MKVSGVEITTKHLQIKKASSTIFGAVSIAAIVVSICLVFLNILWGSSKFNSEVHNELEDARDILIANVEAAPQLEQSFNNLEISGDLLAKQPREKTNSEVILDALPSKYDFPALVSTVNNLAGSTSVKLRSFDGNDLGETAEQASNNPAPVEVPFTVTVEGQYSAIKKFLRGIERSIRPMEVQQIAISGTDDNLRVQVAMVTYYQPAFNLEIITREFSL